MRSSRLHVLYEHAVLALRIHHPDRGAASAGSWSFVDQLETVAWRFRERGSDVIDPQGEMVQTFPASSDEPADVGLGSERFEQLDARRALAEESDTNIRKPLVALKVETEAGLKMLPRGVDGTDRPTDVVDGRQASDTCQEWRSKNHPPVGRY
jgi:hypothetical protein